MSVIIDIIICLIIGICVFFGYKRGLTGVIVKLLSFVLSIVISLVLFRPVSLLIINNTDIDDNIAHSVENILNSSENDKQKKPEVLVKSMDKSIKNAQNEIKENINNYIAKNIAEGIINLLVMTILFIISRVTLFFVKFIFKTITDLPIIKQIDKAGGTIYGILEALLIIYVSLLIISFIKVPELQLAINTSIITSFFYNNNILLMLFF